MNEVMAVVKEVRRRVYLNLVLEHAFNAAFVIVAVLCSITLLAKAVFLPGAMDAIAFSAFVGLLLVAGYATVMARVYELAAAIVADDKLGLAERLSTALVVVGDASPVARAVVDDAREKARGVHVPTRFPISLPARWRHFAVALLAFVGLLCLPQLDLFGRQAAFQRREKDKQEAAKVIDKTRKTVAEIKKVVPPEDLKTLEILENLEIKLAELEKEQLDRSKALAAISGPMEKLAERMKEIAKEFAKENQSLQGELSKAQQDRMLAGAKAMLGKMSEMTKTAGLTPEQREELAKALQEAAKNQELLSQAQKALQEASKALEKGQQLTPEQAQALAKAMQQLAKAMQQQSGSQGQNAQLSQQLQQLAQAMQSGNQQSMQQAMKQAQSMMNTSLKGLNSQMASLTQSMSQMGMAQTGMGDQTLAEMLDSQQMGGDSAADLMAMADAMGGLSGLKGGLGGADSLSLAEALEQLEAAAALSNNRGRGSGFGGSGVGEGNVWPMNPDTGDPLQKEKIGGQMQKGRVLAAFYTPGGNIKNESVAELQNVVLDSKDVAKEALTSQKVPRTLEKVVKTYFENLEVPK